MNISTIGIQLIQHFESCRLSAYLDSVNIPTIGWGSTRYANGSKVKTGDTITQKRADELFGATLPKFEQMVLVKIKRPLEQHEFDPLVSFAYNAGSGYKLHGTWRDFDLWGKVNRKEQIQDYWEHLAITSGGQVLNGLKKRRQSEATLYTTGELLLT